MPNFEKEISIKITIDDFLNELDSDEISELIDFLEEDGHLFKLDLKSTGFLSDEELNDSLMKISDARLQLTNEDTEELKRIAGKYR